METVEELQRRIRSTRDLHSVVKTMKSMAAVNIRQYREAVESLRDYWKNVETGFGFLFRANPTLAAAGAGSHQGLRAAVVFGSDQGMCGALNEDVAGHARDRFAEEGVDFVMAMGGRMHLRLEDADLPLEQYHEMPSSVESVVGSVQQVLFQVDGWRRQGVQVVDLHYARLGSGASSSPVSQRLLPLDRVWTRRLAGSAPRGRTLPMHTMDPDQLLSKLVSEYLFVSLYRAFCESMASENASRLASMQGAESNIEEQLDDLSARYHHRRQMAITEELLDIVTGFEALKSDDEEDEAQQCDEGHSQEQGCEDAQKGRGSASPSGREDGAQSDMDAVTAGQTSAGSATGHDPAD